VSGATVVVCIKQEQKRKNRGGPVHVHVRSFVHRNQHLLSTLLLATGLFVVVHLDDNAPLQLVTESDRCACADARVVPQDVVEL
jgi:hypothetical protein